jgi:hypothetical protein
MDHALMKMSRLGIAMLAALIGAAATGTVPTTGSAQGEDGIETELARETFRDAAWRDRWIVEGSGEISAGDGRLTVNSPQATIWWRQPLPADVAITLTAGVDAPAENNAANLNLFFHAREVDGGAYRFGRSAQYEEYHRIPNYIVTLTGGFQEGWSRVRRNPGFEMLSEERSTRSEAGRTYRIRVVVAGGRLRYWLDGKLIHDVRNKQPLPGGHFALRTWRSRVSWSDVRFAALTRAKEQERNRRSAIWDRGKVGG